MISVMFRQIEKRKLGDKMQSAFLAPIATMAKPEMATPSAGVKMPDLFVLPFITLEFFMSTVGTTAFFNALTIYNHDFFVGLKRFYNKIWNSQQFVDMIKEFFFHNNLLSFENKNNLEVVIITYIFIDV